MAVWYRQTADGASADAQVIEPHSTDQSDADLLAAKYAGAKDKGWDVEWTSDTTFTATKIRWGGIVCTRDFWIE